MNLKQLETLGYYEPGFLHLRINTEHELTDLNQLAANPATSKYFSTFLHEYIHFLQNIGTTSGLLTTIFYIDLIKGMNHEVINDGKPEFKTPFDITNKFNLKANIELRNIYLGDSNNIPYIKYDYYVEEPRAVTDKDGKTVKPISYKVYYHDQSLQLKSFYFGSLCLTEYVAHAIQSKFYPETQHPDVPYIAPELIVNKEFPEFGTDSLLIAALCDACMMSFHPAQQFFNTLRRMKADKFIPKTAIDIYNYIYNGTTFAGEMGNFSVAELFKSTSDLAISQLDNALQSQIFEPNHRWVSHVFISAQKIRISKPDFLVSMVSESGRLSSGFYDIFHELGTPFFTNKKGIGGFVPPRPIDSTDIQPYQLLVFKEIINVFMGEKKCGLYGFCKSHSAKEITNDKCLTAPWERGVEDDLCPFGQFWKTWGLNGQFPVS